MTAVRWGAATDVGRARQLNEDSFFTGERVFVVADGLGGHRAGEVASKIAVDRLAEVDTAGEQDLAAALEDAVRDANRAVYQHAIDDPSTSGMATTVTALAFDGAVAYLAHVGDSRCYLLRGGELSQLSRDHTLVARLIDEGTITPEQAESHPQRSVVTRALGSESNVNVDVDEIALRQGDRLVLCSDGLSSVVPEGRIAELLGQQDVQQSCSDLVDEANTRGGPDNITVIIVEVTGAPAGGGGSGVATLRSPRREPAARPTAAKPASASRKRLPKRAIAWIVIVLVVLFGGLFGVKAWANRSWYVGIDQNKVTIFRGLPTDFIVSLHTVKERTSVTLEQIAPYYRERLKEGIRADSLEKARDIANKAPRATPFQGREALPTPTVSAATGAGSPT